MKQSKSKHEMSGAMKYLKPILAGTVAGAAAMTVILMLLSLLLSLQDIPQILVTPMVLVALATGALLGGNLAARLAREKGLVVGSCCGVLLFLLLWLCGLSLDGGSFGILAASKLVLALVFSAAGGVAGTNVKKHRK